MIRRIFRHAITWWIIAIGWAWTIYCLSSQSDIPQPQFWTPPHIDKIVHAFLYAILACILYPALRLTGLGPNSAAWLAMILASAYGLTDEWHQLSVSGRSTDVWDWVADTVGACSVLLLARRVPDIPPVMESAP